MSETPSATPGRPVPALGRALALALVAMFLMVALGVVWVWQRARREEAWRRQVTSAEPIAPQTAP